MYDNLKAAWIVLLVDNVPPQIRPSDDEWDGVAAELSPRFGSIKLSRVDAAIGALRSEGDVEDIDSRLWNLCAGEGESEADEEVDEILNWMFDNCL